MNSQKAILRRRQADSKHYYSHGNPKAWASRQDWESWKDEFFNTHDADGAYTYPTLLHFSKVKFPGKSKENELKRKWLGWSAGSRDTGAVPYLGDWEAERLLSTTKYGEQVRALREKVKNEMDLLEAGKILADSYLPLQQRVFELWKELETYTGGKILRDLSGLTSNQARKSGEAANMRRLRLYMTGLEWIVDMKVKLDNQFLRALGWDRPQFINYFEGLRRQAQSESEVDGQNSAVVGMLTELTRNQIEKAKMYELQLPDDMQEVVDHIDKEKAK